MQFSVKGITTYALVAQLGTTRSTLRVRAGPAEAILLDRHLGSSPDSGMAPDGGQTAHSGHGILTNNHGTWDMGTRRNAVHS